MTTKFSPKASLMLGFSFSGLPKGNQSKVYRVLRWMLLLRLKAAGEGFWGRLPEKAARVEIAWGKATGGRKAVYGRLRRRLLALAGCITRSIQRNEKRQLVMIIILLSCLLAWESCAGVAFGGFQRIALSRCQFYHVLYIQHMGLIQLKTAASCSQYHRAILYPS